MAIFPANATLLFRTPTGETRLTDGIPQVNSRGLLVVASLAERKAQSTGVTMMADADLFKMSLEGRWITPKITPINLKPGSQAECVLWWLGNGFKLPDSFGSLAEYELFATQNANNIQVRGQFFTRASIQSRFQVQTILGDKLEGHLITEVAWDEAV